MRNNATLEVHITTSDMRYFRGSGATDIRLTNTFPVVEEIALSGAREAKVKVTNELSVDLSGASTLKYAGDPTVISQDIIGASELIKL
ncbi:MAG: hypothetical protein ACI959_000128 [Limisphaerales bacterium]